MTGAGPAADLAALRSRARAIRAATLRMAHAGKTPHVGSALSCADILAVLYFHALRLDPAQPRPREDDRFIMSKGHGCMSYYAALAERGFFAPEVLATYAQNGGPLPEHPTPNGVAGIDIGTGSLGHGLSIGAGIALARQIDGRPGRVFVLLSDGECNEGAVWEAAMFAAGRGLERLVAIVDANRLQAMGPSEEITGPFPWETKWRAFGWATREIDGHDLGGLASALAAAPWEPGRPSALIAQTVKGKGVSFMENDPEWHYRHPSDADLARALEEIGG